MEFENKYLYLYLYLTCKENQLQFMYILFKYITGLLIKFKLYIPISSPNTEP